MATIYPESLSSILLTLLFGICAYFAICWIRLKEKRPSGNEREPKTIFNIVYNDFNSVLSLFTQKKKEEGKEGKEKKDIKPRLRRGGSSSNIKNMGDKSKKVLQRKNSQGTMDLRMSMNVVLCL